MMNKPRPKGSGRGALLAALLLVALMAALSVQLVDLTRFAVFRTSHIDARAHAYWQALGAREFAESVVQRGVDGEVMRSDLTWLSEPQIFPIEDGVITGLISDRNNCFNVNALAGVSSGDDDVNPAEAAARAQRMFDVLMTEIGAPPGQARSLRAQITDWIDADTRPEPGGAEDQTYGAFDPPYRTANTAMAELDEMIWRCRR
jgi:general secretion pathway protein K